VTHGGADPVVSVTEARSLVASMKKAELQVTYNELPRVAHDAWNYAYDGDQLLDWLLQYARPSAQ
jgi:predicted esterase